jgi:hypothetical protein
MTEIQMHLNEVEEVTSRIKEMGTDGLMVEWGSGGSSIRWLETLTDNQRLVSIEHNSEWHSKVVEYLTTRPELNNKFKYYLRPELYGFKHGYGIVNEENPHGLDNYFIPQSDILNANIFFIDGIARATTALFVKFLSTKDDPVIYIHDYYGREQWYSWSTQFFSKREKVGHTLVRLWK